VINQSKGNKKYRANHSRTARTPRKRTSPTSLHQKQESNNVVLYFKKFTQQMLICICIFMGILVIQKAPESATYIGIRGLIHSEIPFAKYNEIYQGVLVNLFPFSYRVPAKQSDLTITVGGFDAEDLDYEREALLQNQLVTTLYQNIKVDTHENGVIIRLTRGEKINSFISGFVIDKGRSTNEEVGDFITIQRPDNWLITIGLLENIEVGKLEYLEIGDTIGSGSDLSNLGEDSYFYLAIQTDNGDYINAKEYLHLMINDIGE